MVPEKINIATVHDRLIEGIKNFFDQCGTEKAIIGLSGGIDSAVVPSLAVEALGNTNVHGFMMPSEFSTLHSIQDAVDLAENLNIKYNVVPIGELYDKFMRELSPVFGSENKWSGAEENLQARIRGCTSLKHIKQKRTMYGLRNIVRRFVGSRNGNRRPL